MRTQWIDACLAMASEPTMFYAGDRKILINKTIKIDDLDADLSAADVGYTPKKIADLTRLYVHDESRAVAAREWIKRTTSRRKKYGSVGFHTYNHLLKAEEAHGRGSVMGPCMQSVAVTCGNGHVRVDVHYRTVEVFRALAADLAFLRDVLLTPFALRSCSLRLHLANATCHPRDFPIVLCCVEDPHREMMRLRRADPTFHKRAVRWLASYVCEEHGASIANYDRGQRGRDAVIRLMDPEWVEVLADYCRNAITSDR